MPRSPSNVRLRHAWREGYGRRMHRTTDPVRYSDRWGARMLEFANNNTRPGMAILEIGGGKRPSIPVEQRPADTSYACLDPDVDGMDKGDYTERLLGHVEDWHPELADRFDLVVSWNAFEHVTDLRRAFQHIHGYLKPDGVFTAVFAGRWSLFAIAARLMPHQVRAKLLLHLLGRGEEDHFPVRYNKCYYSKLVRLMDSEQWVEPTILPLYRAATYLDFPGGQVLKPIYLKYENWSQAHPNLATHYIVSGRRRS